MKVLKDLLQLKFETRFMALCQGT